MKFSDVRDILVSKFLEYASVKSMAGAREKKQIFVWQI